MRGGVRAPPVAPLFLSRGAGKEIKLRMYKIDPPFFNRGVQRAWNNVISGRGVCFKISSFWFKTKNLYGLFKDF